MARDDLKVKCNFDSCDRASFASACRCRRCTLSLSDNLILQQCDKSDSTGKYAFI
jgi:hypothetical protein